MFLDKSLLLLGNPRSAENIFPSSFQLFDYFLDIINCNLSQIIE